MPTQFLTGASAAAGIAAINSIGNLGGFFGPTIIGWSKTVTGGYEAGLIAVAIFLVTSALLVLTLKTSGKDATTASSAR
jgi:ACS family tartrate transporter-like MFS transporter